MGVFDQINDQKRAAAILQRAVLTDRVSHAWLLCGPSAAGLLSLARAFAQTLQCTNRPEGSADACMHCKSCLQAAGGNHPDIRVWSHAKPKNYGIDEIRALVSDVSIRPFCSERKVYIVPDAHLMRVDAQNALLKTMEEPPEYAVILLLSQGEDAMLETIRSRCQTVVLADGEPEYDPELYKTAEDILLHIPSWDLTKIRSAIQSLDPYKTQAGSLLSLFTSWYRDLLYYKASTDPEGLLYSSHTEQIREASRSLSFEEIQHVLDSIHAAAAQLKANVKFELVMELLLLTMQDAGGKTA